MDDLLAGRVRSVYFKYLWTALGSAMISSIYSVVDMAMVGQYQGPEGTAALAVVAPVWNIVYSLGLLMGIGGSVLFSARRGGLGGDPGDGGENEFFTAALIGSVLVTIPAWAMVLFFERPVLTFFGADSALLPLAMTYLKPVKAAFPLFLFTQLLSAFLRNDGDPGRATAAVLGGGVFNIFGDWFFVFALDMGVFGAGLATAMGAAVSLLIALTHFLSKKNTLRLVRPGRLGKKLRSITVTGFSSFFVDVAMGFLTILFNRQIMKYLGGDALAVYGPIINVSTSVQCCAYAVGQAAQPIISTSFGAGKGSRIKAALRYALLTTAAFSLLWTALSLAAPNLYVRIFMSPTAEILRIAPSIIRRYSLSFLLLPLNIFSTYYFQSILKPRAAFVVSVARGLVISGALILLLPTLAGADFIWFAMPITELVVAVYAVAAMRRATAALPQDASAA
mgnify:FL=1